MSASFRSGILLLICTALTSLGCDDGTTPLGGEVREKKQLAGEGEACSDVDVCDDGNPCTTDVCDVGGTGVCIMTNNTDPCNVDNDVCTAGVCDGAGACDETSPLVCDDGNPCTDDACTDPVTGCEYTNDNNNVCTDDGDVCTQAHNCIAGVCVGSNAKVCDDGNDCTDDSCDPVLDCVFVADDSNSCDDGAGCTDNACSGGTCVATDTCDTDPDDCQVETCDVAGDTCVSSDAANNSPCDDDDLCTTGDRCLNGSCDATGTETCDDGNDCTDTSCDPGSGCLFDAVDCSDGSACTDDLCAPVGGCSNPTISCNDNNACTSDSCDPATGCINTDTSASCADANQCTADSCDPIAGCINDTVAMEGTGCNDSNACNVGETCQSGACTGGVAETCDDSEFCTTDTCDPSTGCQFTARTGVACDDGIDCTQNETCNSSGTCATGTPNDSLCNPYDTVCAEALCTGSSGTGCNLFPAAKVDFVCRPATSVCDVAEECDGVSSTCPNDAFASSSTECVAASCSGGVQTDQLFCSGTTATCGTPNTVDCMGLACDGGAPSICLSDCTDSSDCLASHYCDVPSGTCLPRQNPGGACTSDDNCNTAQGDSCVDGVCCNAPCTGQCQACNVAGSVGQCVPVPAGGAPREGGPVGASRVPCSTDGSSCGGACDGVNVSACAFPMAGTECAPAACNAGTNQAVEASVCNGLGACNAPAAVSCDPFVCDGDACRQTCSQDSHCEGNLQCIAGTCVAAFPNGSDCTVGTQCQSGLCVDGVCCSSACGGQCEACNVAGDEGTCTPVSGDPRGARPACSGSGDCAGTCDGSNPAACTFPNTNVTCRQAACTDGTATLTGYCNGSGICPGAQTVACDDGCDGLLCANPECSVSADCGAGEVCRAGMCVPPDENGTACSTAADCASGFCVDGVCCDSSCGGQCEACDVAGSVGECSAVPADSLPRGGRMPCATDGSICGGRCDGTTRNACGYPATGECRPGSCDSSVAIVAATCDGSGACPILEEQDCGAISCDATGAVCDGACASDPDACAADEYCAAGICVDLKESGAPCGRDDHCSSGFCTDGVCCNSDCTEQCGACNVAGSEGTCSPVSGAVVGNRPACEGSGPCSAQCDGQDVRSCSFPGTETRCSAETCESGVETQPGRCGGDGSCVPGEAVSCPTLVCNGSECATSCSEDDECLGELVCVEGACIEDPFIDAVDKGSCGCRMVGDEAPGRSGLPLLLLLPATLLALRRRQRAASLR